MARNIVFNPRGGAESIARRRFAQGASVYRPTLVKGREAPDSVRERLVRYKIAKPGKGRRVCLNDGEAAAAAATAPVAPAEEKKTNPRKKARKATKAKRKAARAGFKKLSKKAARAGVREMKKAGKRKGAKKARKNSAPVVVVPNPRKKGKYGRKQALAVGRTSGGRRTPPVSPEKARKILSDGYVTDRAGKRRKLTAKQRRFFGWLAGGAKKSKSRGRTSRAPRRRAAANGSYALVKAKKAKVTSASAKPSKAHKAKRKSMAKKAKRRGKKAKARKHSRKAGRRAASGRRKSARRAKSRRKGGKRRAKKRNDLVAAAANPKKKRKGKRRKSRAKKRNDLVAAAANPKKRRKGGKRRKARSKRRNDAPSTAQLEALVKKLAPKFERAQSSAARKQAAEAAKRSALVALASRLGVAAPALGPAEDMIDSLAKRLSDNDFKVSKSELKKMLASIPKPTQDIDITSAMAKLAGAIDKLAGKATRGASRKSRKSKKSRSRSRSKRHAANPRHKRRKSRKSAKRRNGGLSKKSVLALIRAEGGSKKKRRKKGKKAKARKSRSKKRSHGRKAARRSKGKRSRRKHHRRNAGFDVVRSVPVVGAPVADFAGQLKDVAINYLPGGAAGLVGAFGLPSLAIGLAPAKFAYLNQGWWGVLSAAVGVGVTSAATAFVAHKVGGYGQARTQGLGAVLGGSLGLLTRAVSALTAPSNPVRRFIGTDAGRMADYAGLEDVLPPNYLGDMVGPALENADSSLVDLDYGQPGDQIGRTADDGIADFAAPALSDFAAPALSDYAAPGSRDDTLQLAGAVPVTDFSMGQQDGTDEMGQSPVDDGSDDGELSDFIEVAGQKTYHQGR